MSFEVFTRKRRSFDPTPRLRVYKRGVIALNPAAYALAERPRYVRLAFDRNRPAAALLPVPDSN